MPSKKPPTPWCDDLRKTFDAFLAKPPSSNLQWEKLKVTIDKALAEAASKIAELKTAGDKTALKNATADAECMAKVKAELKPAQDAWNEGQKTR